MTLTRLHRWTFPSMILCAALTTAALAAPEDKPASTKASRFQLRAIDDGALGIFDEGHPVLVYNHGVREKEGVAEHYFRSSYVHPLYGLDGEVLTDDFPKDHYHHRGVFWAWTIVRTGGKQYDNWALKPGIEGRFERWRERRANDEHAILDIENGWYTGERKVMREDVRIVVHRAQQDSRAIDFELTWTPIDRPVTLQGAAGKSYGGMTIRFAPRERPVITVPSGRTTKDLTIARLKWVDLTGRFSSGPAPSGATLMIHPSHPDFPPTWLTRHYGPLCVGWPGVEPETLPAGKPVRCRYRVWVHRGQPAVAAIERAFQQFKAADSEPAAPQQP